jgi:hypothetical protein
VKWEKEIASSGCSELFQDFSSVQAGMLERDEKCYSIVVGKPEGKRPIERPQHR